MILVGGPVRPIWWHQPLERGFARPQNCLSIRSGPCVDHHDPVYYELAFDLLPSVDDATDETQLVCRFTFRGKARGLDLNEIRGKGTLNRTTGTVQFVPD